MQSKRPGSRSFRVLGLASSIALVILGAVTPGVAKRNDPNVTLRYLPQQTFGKVKLQLQPGVSEVPVVLRLTDRRVGSDAASIGTRTDDDDRLYGLRATNDVVAFVRATLDDSLRGRGFRVTPGSPSTLHFHLATYKVREVNQPVGATYHSEVQLWLELKRHPDATLWSGTGNGRAARYGKKFSNSNVNEVLSDALLESVADVLGRDEFQQALLSESSDAPTDAEAAAVYKRPVSAAELFAELQSLMKHDADMTTLLEYVGRYRLTAPLTDADTKAWRKAGIPEEIVRAANSVR